MTKTMNDEKFWNKMAVRYSRSKISDMAGYEKSLDRTKSYLKKSDRVYEFGCGTGSTALKLAPFVKEMISSDVSGNMIEIAKGKLAETELSNLTFVQENFANLKLNQYKSFDVVMGFNALHMMADLNGAVETAYELLKPKGLFISKTPCLNDMNFLVRALVPVAQMVGFAPTVNKFDDLDLKFALENAGFEIIAFEKHGTKGKDTRPYIVAQK